MENAEPPSNWKLLNGRIDEIFGLLEYIRASMESVNPAEWGNVNDELDEIASRLAAMQAKLESNDSADKWAHMHRRIDEIFGVLIALKGERQDGTAQKINTNHRGLFVVGHARSGTTVLANALNSSDQVCCLMEPYFYRSIDLVNFADSFNKMHQSFGNPPVKGYWVPGLGGATGRRVIEHLLTSYRYVGEKLAFRQHQKYYDPDKFFEFAVAQYDRSPFICVIRDPIKVTSSVIDMFEASDYSPETIASVVRSQLETYLLILRLSLSVPLFYLLVHENVDNTVLATLGSQLSISLERAMDVYSSDVKVTAHSAESHQILADNSNVVMLQEMYDQITGLVDQKSLRIRSDGFWEARRICEAV